MCSNTQCKKNQLPGRLPCYRYVRIHSTAMLCSLWLALCVFFAVSSVTTAKDCRATRNVLLSTESLQRNALLGGHVWNHVWGLTKRLTMDMRHQQAVGKTMFASSGDFTKAWTSFVKYQPTTKFSQCGAAKRPKKDCIPASALGITKAYQCTSIDAATGLCDAYVTIGQGLKVGFWYAHSNDKWILNTAYPSNHPQCL